MQTTIQKAIEDIKGYKAFGKTIDIDFVIVLLNSHFKEEKQDMKQTSIEWLIDALENPHKNINWQDAKQQAKEMHKQEIIDAWNSAGGGDAYHQGKEYYQETFSMSEIPTNSNYSEKPNLLEISDEEIKKAAIGMGIASSIATAYFIEGAEWYREQLKSK